MRIRIPDVISLETDGGTYSGTDRRLVSADACVTCELTGDALRVNLTGGDTPLRFVKLTWNFTPSEMRTEPVRVLSDCWERSYGDLAWGSVQPYKLMPWAFAVSNGTDSARDVSTRYTECWGVSVRPKAFCAWQYERRGVTLTLDIRCGGAGVRLMGRELAVCEVKTGEYRCMSAYMALKRFYAGLCSDALTLEKPVYGSNNWYYAYGKSSRAQILRDAELISRLCAGNQNRPYMVIDAGWSEHWGSAPWDAGNREFGDMRALAQEIAARGAIPGIWVRYLSDEDGALKDIPDAWRQKRDRRYLDPSHPEVLSEVKRITRLLTQEWGYKLIKHDFSCHDMFGDWGFRRPSWLAEYKESFFDETRTSAEIAVELYKTVYESAAPGTVILACNAPGFLTAGLCHINRAGDDTSGKSWERTRRMGVNSAAFRFMYDGAFYKADHDCVGVTGQIPWEKNRKWLELVSKTGTPLFVSVDPDVPTDAQLSELSEALRHAQTQTDSAVPLDWMDTCCPERWLINGEETEYDWR